MRAQPDRIAFGPSARPRPPGRGGPALLVGAGLVCVLLVAALVYVVAVRTPRAPDATAGIPTVQPSTAEARTSPPRPAAIGSPDDTGVPSKESARAAATFVDAWLTKDRKRRLDRLKELTVTSLYEGLTYTDPAEIPAAHRVGRPRVEDAGSYLVRYRVTLSDRSEVLVSTMYDGTQWLVGSVEPSVG